jgi:proline iminopeptidase
MPTFAAPDGTVLAYHPIGSGTGTPVVCLPGGPMQASVYLGDLGGLAEHRQLVMLDLRGTGDSAVPADHATYRCDRQVADVEALREHLGLEKVTLLGHSAGGSLAVQYAAEHPQRIGLLALITPSTRAIGTEVPAELRRQILALRKDEPWFATVSSAFESISAGTATEADWDAIAPMAYGRWDATTKAHHAAEAGQRNDEADKVFYSDGGPEPADIRAALAAVRAPVLVLAGELDWVTSPAMAAEFIELFPNAELVVQSDTSHFPWLDNTPNFIATVTRFLDG